MKANRKLYLFACAALTLGPALTGCATGPQPPQPGTPAFYWAAARETYRTGDFAKTNDNLSQLTKTDNEFTRRALLWEIVTSSGLAQGYMVLADTYEAGARAARNNPTPFRKQVTILRGQASNAALQFAEAFHRYQDAVKDPTITLDFDFPSGNAAQPPELKKVASGIFVQESELALLQKAMTQRGVLLSTCRAVGAKDDTAKALEIFKTGKPQVDLQVFKMQMASMLHEQAQLFGPAKLDQPPRVKMLCTEAKEALDSLPPTKQTKDLLNKIQGTLKKSKVS